MGVILGLVTGQVSPQLGLTDILVRRIASVNENPDPRLMTENTEILRGKSIRSPKVDQNLLFLLSKPPLNRLKPHLCKNIDIPCLLICFIIKCR